MGQIRLCHLRIRKKRGKKKHLTIIAQTLKKTKIMSKKNISTIFYLVSFIFLLFSASCNLSENNADTKTDSLKVEKNENHDYYSQKVFYSLPSPLETASLIRKTGVTYREEILNPISNYHNYDTNNSMALNLGIYGADLSFANIFDQQQTSLKYITIVKKMADRIGILDAVDSKDLKQLEESISDREKTMNLISKIFLNSDIYLNENNRPEIAVLVGFGGWLESLYIALRLSEKSIDINKELVSRIIDQRLSLNIAIRSLDTYAHNPEIYEIYEDALALKKIYDKIVVVKTIMVMDKKTNISSMQQEEQVSLTPYLFIQLYDKVTNIRKKYTE